MDYKVACLIGVAVIETLISFFFFNQVFERKRDTLPSLLICGGLYFAGVAINIFIGSAVVNAIYYAALNTAFALLCFRADFKKSVFYSIIIDVFSTGFEILVIYVITNTIGKTLDPYSSLSSLFLVGLFSKLLLFSSLIILSRFLNKGITSTKFPKGFYAFPITTILTLLGLWYISVSITVNVYTEYIFSGIIALMFISTVILFISYHYTEMKDLTIYRLEAEIERIKIEQSHYDILKKQNGDVLKYAHDAKNHLAAIKNLNDNPEIDSYIDKMSNDLQIYTKVNHTGNTTLDVILNKYSYECDINGIRFECDARTSNLMFVESYDLIAVLGNLMDNAVEAAIKSKEKTIMLETDNRNNYAVVVITNSCDSPPVSNENTLLTTKTDKKFHGIGLKSVKRVLSKYNGDFSWEYDKEKSLFSVTVSFFEREH